MIIDWLGSDFVVADMFGLTACKYLYENIREDEREKRGAGEEMTVYKR